MRSWSDDAQKCVSVSELLLPLKRIITEGYALERRPCVNFTYLGYNIGEADMLTSPNPTERFSARWLKNEQKMGRYLIDNVLTTAYQLGVEQGRRAERHNKIPYHLLQIMYESRGEKLADLRARLREYGEDHEIIANIPLESDAFDLEIPQISNDDEPSEPQSGN